MTRKYKIIFAFALFVLVFLLFEIVFEKKGVLHLFELKNKVALIEHENSTLKEENRKLSLIIERLKNDQKYVESIARKDLGMVSKDEIIFKFKDEKNRKAEKK